jgi:hypothetical protein
MQSNFDEKRGREISLSFLFRYSSGVDYYLFFQKGIDKSIKVWYNINVNKRNEDNKYEARRNEPYHRRGTHNQSRQPLEAQSRRK